MKNAARRSLKFVLDKSRRAAYNVAIPIEERQTCDGEKYLVVPMFREPRMVESGPEETGEWPPEGGLNGGSSSQ